ncbi:MAG: hypothetical protein IJ644_03005 [Oscillospiraceae bacterium]|nr:hypothetical protein [Oscillospiraceae bacterium]
MEKKEEKQTAKKKKFAPFYIFGSLAVCGASFLFLPILLDKVTATIYKKMYMPEDEEE